MAAELASAKLNAENHLLLEQPLLKVPYELHRKNFKTAQRHIERERDQALSTLKTTASACRAYETAAQQGFTQNGHSPTDTALSNLDDIITRMKTLKRKLEHLHTEEKQTQRATRARIHHLQTLHAIPSLADVAYDDWSKVRLNRLLVDYLLRKGYTTSARDFAAATKISDLVDVDAFVSCAKVEKSLLEGRTNEALAWCAENRQNLKKMGSSLEFELRLQQYIEMVRTGQPAKFLEAAAHASKYLSGHSEPGRAVQAAALLAYQPGTHVEPYKSLYAPARYPHLKTLFTTTHHTLLALPPTPPLHIALSAGLSALKTPACHSIHAASSGNVSTATSGTSVCPICSTELNELARTVPYAHHTRSWIEEDPVVLPNGRVYGRERLRRLNEKMVPVEEGGGGGAGGSNGEGEGAVRDPMATGEMFGWGEVGKVYIS